MRFAFFATHPVHESVPFFASLLRDRGHTVDVIDDGRRLLTERGYGAGYDLGWYRFSPDRDRTLPDVAWETLLGFEAAGTRVLNSSRSLMLARNKFLAAFCFQRSGVEQPETELLGEDEPAFAPPYVVKPIFGALSKNLAIVESHGEAIAHGSRYGPCIVQRYLEGAEVLRVIVGGDRALLIREKRLDAGGVYAPPRRPTADESGVCELARSMVLAVGGEFMGVDILVHDGSPLALEVNGSFGFAPDWKEGGTILAGEFERAAGGARS
jgi:glutathione synthase/RimK-type ligase-like ATP-grasp enzyme